MRALRDHPLLATVALVWCVSLVTWLALRVMRDGVAAPSVAEVVARTVVWALVPLLFLAGAVIRRRT